MTDNESYIDVSLIYRIIEGRATEKDVQIFNEWINESPNHSLYYDRFRIYQLNQEESTDYNVYKAYCSMRKRLDRRRRIVMYKRISAIASLIILTLGIGIFLMKEERKDLKEKQVVLSCANGSLHVVQDGIDLNNPNLEISDSVAIYSKNKMNRPQGISYNQLSIPKGKRFKLILDDGSIVWLNADSRIKFPEQFLDTIREVYLEGEAFFEVAEDSLRPFKVYTIMQTIEVKGTRFGVAAYANDDEVRTTLVDGRVDVHVNRKKYHLVPGYQLRATSDNIVEVDKVNVEDYISWYYGVLKFTQKSLPYILKAISREYDVDIVFINETKRDKVLSGELKTNLSLQDMLGLIEQTTEVELILRDDTIFVQ